MLQAFRNAFVIPDLRAKLFVTLGILAVYRLLVFIPTPGINAELFAQQVASNNVLQNCNGAFLPNQVTKFFWSPFTC